MWKKIKELLNRKKRVVVDPDRFTIDMLRGCPDCKANNFFEGPSAGVCVNVECAKCGSRFNVEIMSGTAERI